MENTISSSDRISSNSCSLLASVSVLESAKALRRQLMLWSCTTVSNSLVASVSVMQKLTHRRALYSRFHVWDAAVPVCHVHEPAQCRLMYLAAYICTQT